jgi:hypothetical protein
LNTNSSPAVTKSASNVELEVNLDDGARRGAPAWTGAEILALYYPKWLSEQKVPKHPVNPL